MRSLSMHAPRAGGSLRRKLARHMRATGSHMRRAGFIHGARARAAQPLQAVIADRPPWMERAATLLVMHPLLATPLGRSLHSCADVARRLRPARLGTTPSTRPSPAPWAATPYRCTPAGSSTRTCSTTRSSGQGGAAAQCVRRVVTPEANQPISQPSMRPERRLGCRDRRVALGKVPAVSSWVFLLEVGGARQQPKAWIAMYVRAEIGAHSPDSDDF